MTGDASARALPPPVLEALSPLPAPYRQLLERVVEALSQDPRVLAVWVSGSAARALADRASDLDLLVTVEDGSREAFSAHFPVWREAISPTVLAQVVVPARVFTLVTPDWLRYDVVVEEAGELRRAVTAPRLPCWDKQGLAAHLSVGEEQNGPSPEAVSRLVTEWFRVTAMPKCITARDDWLLATVHVHYLRDLLYRLFVESRRPMPARGVKWWSGRLSERQRDALSHLPVSAPDGDALMEAHLLLSRVFLGTAESLLARLGAPWPAALEAAAARHLASDWNLNDPYPRGEALDG